MTAKVISLFGPGRRRPRAAAPAPTATPKPPPPSWLEPVVPPEPYDPERAHRGANLCRALLAPAVDSGPLDPDDPVRDLALRRARREPRESA